MRSNKSSGWDRRELFQAAAAAGLATLEVLKRPGSYDKIFATGTELMTGITRMLEKAGLPAQIIGVPPLFDIVYAAVDPRVRYS